MESERIESGYEKVIRYVYDKVQDGTYTAGSKLPTERSLAEELGIGRNSTREALSILHGMGMIRRVQGSGNYLSGDGGKSVYQILRMLLALGTISWKDVCEFRRMMEKSVVMYLLEHSIPDERSQELEKILEQMETFLRNESRKEETAESVSEEVSHAETACDKQFHDTLILATENTLFITLMQAVTEVYREWIDHVLGKMDSGHKQKLLAYHRSIYEGIRNGDREAAMTAVDRHYDLIEQIEKIEQEGDL